jgi:hypothetical protein
LLFDRQDNGLNAELRQVTREVNDALAADGAARRKVVRYEKRAVFSVVFAMVVH